MLAVLLAGCSPAPGRAAVDVREFKFLPATLAVKPGTRVTWTNQDTVLHIVTSGDVTGAENRPDGRFQGRLDGRGTSLTVTFRKAGTFTYYCSRHNVMTGRITVAG